MTSTNAKMLLALSMMRCQDEPLRRRCGQGGQQELEPGRTRQLLVRSTRWRVLLFIVSPFKQISALSKHKTSWQ